jgi:hypothetical protein
MHLTDMLKMNPYAKYMKDIVTNKRKIPEAEISTMLANYTFMGGIPKKLGDPGVPTIPCSIKRIYVRTALCDLGAGVSVMPLSLYRRIELNKLTPTEYLCIWPINPSLYLSVFVRTCLLWLQTLLF